MITEDYVSLEVAKLLKEKGFTEECEYFYAWYKESESYHICSRGGTCNNEEYPDEYSMPTHQMAMKWLREEKHIILVFKPGSFSGEECIFWTYEKWAGDNFEGEVMSFRTYEEAVEAALKYCLENLI